MATGNSRPLSKVSALPQQRRSGSSYLHAAIAQVTDKL